MADPKEPKKETVRITLPPRPSAPAPAGAAPTRDTVRINLPARPPANPAAVRPTAAPLIPPPSAAPVLRPPTAQAPVPRAPTKAIAPPPFVPPARPAAGSAAAATAPAPPRPVPIPAPAASASPLPSPISATPGPKKETARITVLPDPPAKAASSVQMKKTQPLVTMPEARVEPAPILVATSDEPVATLVGQVPMSISWAVLGVSGLILLIQIWNYLV